MPELSAEVPALSARWKIRTRLAPEDAELFEALFMATASSIKCLEQELKSQVQCLKQELKSQAQLHAKEVSSRFMRRAS